MSREWEFSSRVAVATNESETSDLSDFVEQTCDIQFVMNGLRPARANRMIQAMKMAQMLSAPTGLSQNSRLPEKHERTEKAMTVAS